MQWTGARAAPGASQHPAALAWEARAPASRGGRSACGVTLPCEAAPRPITTTSSPVKEFRGLGAKIRSQACHSARPSALLAASAREQRGQLRAAARERPPQAADIGWRHPPALVKAKRVLVAGDDGQPHQPTRRGPPIDLLHEQRADPQRRNSAQPRAPGARPSARWSRSSNRSRKSGRRRSQRRAFLLGDQQPGVTSAHPALESPSPPPGIFRAPKWRNLADFTGRLGVILVHGSPQRLYVVEPNPPRLDDLDLGGAVCSRSLDEPTLSERWREFQRGAGDSGGLSVPLMPPLPRRARALRLHQRHRLGAAARARASFR